MNKKPLACVDIDRTLMPDMPYDIEFGSFIDPFPGAKEFLEKLSQYYDIIIYSCRTNVDFQWGYNNVKPLEVLKKEIQEWLDEHGLIFHYIWGGQGKPHAAVYIDDRAITCAPQENPNAYKLVLEEGLGIYEET